MLRRVRAKILALGACAAGIVVTGCAARPQQAEPFSIVEAGIADLRRAMESGGVSAREITAQYLARIDRYEPRLNALITLNPRALDEAAVRDRERSAGRVRGPLHGIPIALKDNIHTTDMPTTGGALAFANLRPPYEATITRLLRGAGAIIIAKTTLTELANWVAPEMPNGYNALVRYSFNPYEPGAGTGPDPRPRIDPGGSSSGIGTAASFWAANVGTETSGSLLNPANQTMLVTIKPTVGRVSRHGVMPITADQDTPGPMARSVADAALLLGVLEGARRDPNDPATGACTRPPSGDYTRFLRRDGLQGARIGIPRAFFYEPLKTGRVGIPPVAITADAARLMADAIAALRAAGTTIVDPADVPSVVAPDPSNSILSWRICAGPAGAKGRDAGCSTVLKYGMKRDFNRWLASLGDAAPVDTLTELRGWNRAHTSDGAIAFGQEALDISDEVDLAADRARYEADRAKDIRLTETEGIDAALRAHRLDALLFPGHAGAFIPARAGYPSITVPFGFVGDAPFGVTFTSGACSEPRLIELASAFEMATMRRVPPRLE